jgi:hypothetical protein
MHSKRYNSEERASSNIVATARRMSRQSPQLWLEGHPVEMQGSVAERISKLEAFLNAVMASGGELTGDQVRRSIMLCEPAMRRGIWYVL